VGIRSRSGEKREGGGDRTKDGTNGATPGNLNRFCEKKKKKLLRERQSKTQALHQRKVLLEENTKEGGAKSTKGGQKRKGFAGRSRENVDRST